jgi:hypothetical protein
VPASTPHVPHVTVYVGLCGLLCGEHPSGCGLDWRIMLQLVAKAPPSTSCCLIFTHRLSSNMVCRVCCPSGVAVHNVFAGLCRACGSVCGEACHNLSVTISLAHNEELASADADHRMSSDDSPDDCPGS